jgi:phosphate transport system substrate-binding protein
VLKKKPIVWLSLLLALGLLVAACGKDKKNDTSSSTSTTVAGAAGSVDYSKLSGTIKGSGSSFTDAFVQAGIDAFSTKSDLSVTYNPVGSGQGKKDFGGSLTDFAGTDSKVKAGDGPTDGSYLYVPTVAAPITISYNLPAVKDLKLSADTLAGIFQGTIKKWNDPAIAADNTGASLPSTAIVIVHRADGSGTTSNFTKYLAKAAPTAWKLGSGDSVAWPADSQAGQKNPGVAQIIKSTAGAVGYVDLSDAKETGLVLASIKNHDGQYVAPTIDGSAAALANAVVADDGTYDPLDAAGAAAYPITSPTYLLVRTSYASQATADNVKGFVTFLLTDGQALAKGVSFTGLPDALKTKALAQLDKVTVG